MHFWKHDVTKPLKVTYTKLLYSFQLSTKVITQTNQNSHKQFIEPIRTLTRSAIGAKRGKNAR